MSSSVCEYCDDNVEVMSCEHWKSENKCRLCIDYDIPTALYNNQCLYCILLGREPLVDVEWDTYDETVLKAFGAFQSGMEDGYHQKPLIPGFADRYGLLTHYNAGYEAGLNKLRLEQQIRLLTLLNP